MDGRLEVRTRGLTSVPPLADPQRDRGVWNDLELIVFEGTAIQLLNGQVVCVTSNARTTQDQPVRNGEIALVGFHGTVYFRNLQVRDIDDLPPGIVELAR